MRRTFAVVAAVALVCVIGYAVLVFRTCDHAHDVLRGSYKYRLCSFDSELITRVPLLKAKEEPRFAWRNLDGNKPTLHWLTYTSTATSSELTQGLERFWAASGFRKGEMRDGCEWWTSEHTEMCLQLEPIADSAQQVTVTHNLGFD